MSATADKVDHGLMTFRATEKDHRELKHILEQGFYSKPNYSHWIYKNRSGQNNCIIWTVMDLGTMREKPLFVTDTDFNLIDNMKMLDIQLSDFKNSFSDNEEEQEEQTEQTEELVF